MATLFRFSLLLVLLASAPALAAPPTLEVFAGSASRPAAEELARRFEGATGARVAVHFGGSGALLAQLELTGRGDVYFPGSSEFMALAVARGLVDPATETPVFYRLPALLVPRDNPKNLRGLKDLARPGVRVGLARPDTVACGLYGAEVLEAAGLAAAVRPNVVSYAESCEKAVGLLSLGLVDAALAWAELGGWDPGRVESVPLPPAALPRIGVVPAAVVARSRQPALARQFVAFLAGAEGQAILARHGYSTDLAAIRRQARPGAPLGGRFEPAPGWR